MRAALVLPLLLVSFAGCVDGDAASIPDGSSLPDADVPATVASTSITALDAVPAPVWTRGTAFGHHVFFGADDEEGEHYSTIVTSVEGDSYFLASDNEQAARDEAAFDIPILGPVRKSDLHVTGLGGDWDFFKFPLKDGLTWDSTFTVALGEAPLSWDVTHVASFNPAIETPHGPRPGFDIVAHTAEGEQLLYYDYVPDLGWYAHLFVYDLTTEEDGDFAFHVMSMGRTSEWHGEYFVYEGKNLAQQISAFYPVDPDDPGAEPWIDPKPYATFTMDSGSTYLYGFLFAIAVGGVQEVLLIDPDGEIHEVRAVGAPIAEEGGDIDLPAVPGEWKIVSAGAGAVAVSAAFLWQLTAQHGTL